MNKTALNEHVHKWIPEPTGRGTAGLLSSCFLTILICTWNAVHIDVPSRKFSTLKILLYKLCCMFLLIIAPEWVLGHAIADLFDVRTLEDLSRQWPRSFFEVSI